MQGATLPSGAILVLAAFAPGQLSAQDADTGPEPSRTLCSAQNGQ